MFKSGRASAVGARLFVLVGHIHFCLTTINAQSLAAAHSGLYASLSSSYSTSTTWQGRDLRNFTFVGNLQYRHALNDSSHGHAHQVLADLGYLKFVDSIWTKNLDRFQVNLLWSNTGRKLKHSYSVVLSSQFLSIKRTEWNSELGKLVERDVGGFLRPFSLEMGYGSVFNFWRTSSINFAFATLKLSGYPKEITAPTFADATFIQGGEMNYFMSYGLGVVTAINKPIGKRLQWMNNSRAFCNGFDKDHVNFDFSNMVIVKIWKFFQLRFDTRLAYNPVINHQLQFRQEALIGFFYERNR